jgi:signal transduction histidine kinase
VVKNALCTSSALSVHGQLSFGRAFFSLTIIDDGHGIDPQILAAGGKKGHWGMLGMRERSRKIGAQLTIISPPQGGTEVKLRIPANLAYTKRHTFHWWNPILGLKKPSSGS